MQALSFRLAVAAIIAEFTISANLLAYLGVPYTSEGGPIIGKLHPGTYFCIASIAAHICRNDNSLQFIWIIIYRERGLVLFLACISVCLLSAACFTGIGNLITLLDSFLPAGIIAVVLADMTALQTAGLARTVRTLLSLSATVAIGEAVIACHLVPVVSAGPQQTSEFRPVGLYDHPLTGAAATMMGLLLSRALARAPWQRAAYQAWLLIALLAFGGRIALMITGIAGGVLYLARLRSFAALRPLRVWDFIPLFVVGASVIPLAWTAYAVGWAVRLQRHFFWDASAQARIAQFHLLGLMSPSQLMFGCQRDDLVALIEPLRLAYGVDVIENFWLLHFAALGLFGFAAFAAGMTGLMAWLWQRSNTDGRVVLLSFIFVTSTSNSLGRKSTLLVILVACLLAMARTSVGTATADTQRITLNKFAFKV